MEEKERYIVGKGEDIFIADNDRKVMFTITTKKLQDLLNQQDKRIKELEEKISIQLSNNADNVNFMENQRRENQQLKQQLHDLPNKIVGEIREKLNNIVEVGDYFDIETDEETNLLRQSDIENILDTILKKYGGEDE